MGTASLPSDLLFRSLTKADSIPEITRLLHAAYRPPLQRGLRYHASHQADEDTRRRCHAGETTLVLKNAAIVGTITLKPPAQCSGSPWYDRADVASFGQFAVWPDLQGTGIGSALLDRVEARAAEMGAAELALDTAEPATDLIARYASRGYRFIEFQSWAITNYRSVILSKSLL